MLQNVTLLLVSERLDRRNLRRLLQHQLSRLLLLLLFRLLLLLLFVRRSFRRILPRSSHPTAVPTRTAVITANTRHRLLLPDPLRLPPDDPPAVAAAALALLPFRRIEQREVVIVRQFLSRFDVAQGEQRHPELSVHGPLLHLAVRLAGVIDETAVAAHAVAVYHQAAVQVEAVVVGVVHVSGGHSFLELLVGYYFSDVL